MAKIRLKTPILGCIKPPLDFKFVSIASGATELFPTKHYKKLKN